MSICTMEEIYIMKKIFISYCWDQYDYFVEELAKQLHSLNLYEIIFDKWELKHGNKMTLFMEESIRKADKVFVICEKEYSRKANGRLSGAGVETSIISSKVYRDNKQTKFVPVYLEGEGERPDYMDDIYGIMIDDANKGINSIKLQEFINAIEERSILEKPENSTVVDIETIPPKKSNVSVNEKIRKGDYDIEVYEKIGKLMNEEMLEKYLVKYKLEGFGNLILKFDKGMQEKIINLMEENYSEATGVYANLKLGQSLIEN